MIMIDSSGNRIILRVLGKEQIHKNYVSWARSMAGKLTSNDNPYKCYVPDIKLVRRLDVK